VLVVVVVVVEDEFAASVVYSATSPAVARASVGGREEGMWDGGEGLGVSGRKVIVLVQRRGGKAARGRGEERKRKNIMLGVWKWVL